MVLCSGSPGVLSMYVSFLWLARWGLLKIEDEEIVTTMTGSLLKYRFLQLAIGPLHD